MSMGEFKDLHKEAHNGECCPYTGRSPWLETNCYGQEYPASKTVLFRRVIARAKDRPREL
jgi:hypothetical protein